MPRKKAGRLEDEGGWRIFAEEMRAQFAVFGDALDGGLRSVRSDLHEIQEHNDGRFDVLEAAVRHNAEAVRGLSARTGALTERVDHLTLRVDHVVDKVDHLTDRVDHLTVRVDHLSDRIDHLSDRVAQSRPSSPGSVRWNRTTLSASGGRT